MKNRGFTLVELIITIVILGVIGVFSFEFITETIQVFVSVSNEQDVARETRLSLERMGREVRAATNIVSPAFDTSASSITFARSQPPLSVDTSTQVTYQLSGSTLQRQRDSNTPETLAVNVTGFTVTRSPDPGELITLDLTLAVTGSLPVHHRTVIYPRYFKYQ